MIYTDRLILKPLTPFDAESVFEWLSDKEVCRYLLPEPFKYLSEAEKWIASVRSCGNLFGFFLKADGKLIGSGDATFHAEDKSYNIGYMLHRAYWNKGYATEGVRGIILWAKENFGAKKFVASCAVENIASRRVIEKNGFVFSHFGTYSVSGKVFQSRYYELKY